MTNASRKAKERASRKAKGQVRVEVWLGECDSYRLDLMVKDMGFKTRASALAHLVRAGRID